MSHRENIARIKAVHYALEELAKDVVFVGGATVSLYYYLKNEFQKLLDQKYIDEWIGAHLEYNEQNRVGYIIGSMSEFVDN